MKVTILGCGTSAGVPRIGGGNGQGAWGACNPMNPRNRRRRCSVLVQESGKTVLVDTSPDVRAQLIDAGVRRVDAVLWTHDHADQTHGIDDLRPLALRDGPIPAWGDARTLGILGRRFDYCFKGEFFYTPIYNAHTIVAGRRFSAGGIDVLPFEQDHGTCISLGFRFGSVAYANDVVRLDEAAFSALSGVDVLIVDAMRYAPHGTHAHLDRALEWIERLRPKQAFLTNMHVDMDYDEVNARTPPHVQPAYDGLVIAV